MTSSKTNVGPDKDSDKRQLAAIEAYAKAAGLEIVATFYDTAVSGADPVTDRPGFAEMLERLLSNGARTIVVAKRLGGAPIGAARCRNWLKVKNPDFRTIDFCAAAGFTPTLGIKLVHKVSRSGIVPIPVEHVHPGGMRRASHVYPTLEQRGLGASRAVPDQFDSGGFSNRCRSDSTCWLGGGQPGWRIRRICGTG